MRVMTVLASHTEHDILCYELADSLNSFGRIKVSLYLCSANSKNKYDETDKKDVAAIGPADSGRSNGTE